MKKISLLFLFIFMVTVANAQSNDKPAVGIAFDALLPFSKQPYGAANGVSLKFEIPVAPNWMLTLTPAYMVQSKNKRVEFDYFGPGPSTFPYKFAVLKAGARYFYHPKLYAEAEAGDAYKTGQESKHTFIYSAGLGVLLTFNQHNALDIGVRLENQPRTQFFNQSHFLNQFGARMGYRFSF